MPRISPGEYFDEDGQQDYPEFRGNTAALAPSPVQSQLQAACQQIGLLTKETLRQGRLLELLSDGDEYRKAVERLKEEEQVKAGRDPRVDELYGVVANMAETLNKLGSSLPVMIGDALRKMAPVSQPDFAGEIADELSSTVKQPNPEKPKALGQRRRTGPENRENGKSQAIADGMEREIH